MRLHPEPFSQIINGLKNVESRLYDDKRRNIHIGDEIVFVYRESGEKVLVKVVALHICEDFKSLFDLLPIKTFGAESVEGLYSVRDYYKAEDEEKIGVIGIEFEKI
jgi:ASC-1-like (ASCH) protein